MDETPEDRIARLFEFETCPECGGDAEDHVVCIVPGIGNYFARCLRADADDPIDGGPHITGGAAEGVPGRLADRIDRHHPKGRGLPGPFGARP